MTTPRLPEDLVRRTSEGPKIILVVLDGLGGLPHPESGETELEAARTPNLDRLAASSSIGLLAPVGEGITPGSGPGHLALFGYDPVENLIGRGVLSALGVGFDLRPGDMAARLNLATFDADGLVTDRRAGRPSDDVAAAVVQKVVDGLVTPDGVEVFLVPEKEHRVVMVLRGEGLVAELDDTDPQREGLADLPVRALVPEAESTAAIVQNVLDQFRTILEGESPANGALARGFANFAPYPSFMDRFGLRAMASAKYPMYRGVARLAGMEIVEVPESTSDTVGVVERHLAHFDFAFAHFKDTDSAGHDGDFMAKVAAIQEVDTLIPRLEALEPDVIIFTGDHSTPTIYREHSWHHVPLMIVSRWGRPTDDNFGERACAGGDLGVIRGKDLMTLALAHAARLEKYGA